MNFGSDTIQEGLIDKIKSITAITSLVTNSDSIVEIRESEWQGTDFEYPNIRLRLGPTQMPIEGCGPADLSITWEVFSEQKSSKQSMEIGRTVGLNFPKSFTYNDGSNDFLFTGIRVRVYSRPFRNLGIWQHNVEMIGKISG